MEIIYPKDKELTITSLKKILEMAKSENARLNNLEDYYLGKHSILRRVTQDPSKPNNKLVNPYPTYITDTLTGYFVGEPVTYTSLEENALEALKLTLEYSDVAAEDTELAKNMSIFGKAYELLQIDENGITRFTSLNPKEVIIVYDDTIEKNIMYGIRKIACKDIDSDKKYYRVEVYSAVDCKIYTSDENLSTLSLLEQKDLFFNDVPIVEYKNNAYSIGDFENVISLIDAYDLMASDSINDYSYFVDAYLMLTGVTADAEDIAEMKENRVLLLDEDSKAEWLIKNSSDTSIENLKNRLNEDIHKFAKVPNLGDKEFASNASGVAIKYKLYGTETLISNKERYFKKGLQRRIELIFNIANLKGNAFDWRSVDITFTRNLPTNEDEIANVVQKLSGVVSTETLLAQVPFVDDVQGEMEKLEKQRITSPFYNLEREMGVIDDEA